MKSNILMTAIALLFAASTPAAAQMQDGAMSNGAMASDHGMMASHRMSAADRRMMTRCKGMSHTAMMRSAGCKKMMRMHPDMMRAG